MSARLLADEHIDLRVVRGLRMLGHDVVHAHQYLKDDARDAGPEDVDLLEIATRDERAVVTDNVKHFRLLHTEGRWHAGIVACIRDDRNPKRKAKAIDRAIRDTLRDVGTLSGQFIHVSYDVRRRRSKRRRRGPG
jgi:predicted nuclease of predicted toxin-antitoxin system